MTVEVEAQQDAPAEAVCWCCGNPFPDQDLVRLGQHPEVGVCFRCARWLDRRAVQRRDERRPTVGGHVRGGVRGIREAVIRRGWHRRAVIGPLLRRLNRRLP
jgi:hypothetical protein